MLQRCNTRKIFLLFLKIEGGYMQKDETLVQIQDRYRNIIENDLMRFWQKAFDRTNGGIYTCFTNSGDRLLSTDKYIWSQGRMLWLLARLCEMHSRGLVSIPYADYAQQADKTFLFISEHALLKDNGVCAYLLTETGEKKESVPGKGYYTSYFVDCFVIMGFMEYGRVFRHPQAIELGLAVYDRMMAYLSRGEILSEPYPVKSGFRPQSKSMILCNTCKVALDALKSVRHPRSQEFAALAKQHMKDILYGFYNADNGLIREMVCDDPQYDDSVLVRHVAPGHTNECMWFCMDAADDDKDLQRIYSIVLRNMQAGWDADYGGIYRFIDRDGGRPKGRMLDAPYESLIADTWDTKLWWVNAESLYVSLRCWLQTGKQQFADLYKKIDSYVFTHFPNPDRDIGEWIQILDRQGKPLNKVVALPVKDPYHILRDIMLSMEALEKYK
jgi:N-acyl-D-glucosamine 2-epimerase